MQLELHSEGVFVEGRIAEFAAEAAHDAPGATRRLHADLVASGGPLVERVEGDERVRVTFVWIGPQTDVSVRAQVFDDPLALSHPMRRVEGTDVWWRQALVAPAVVTTYQYLVDDPFRGVDPTDLAAVGAVLGALRERSFADPVNPRSLFPQTAVIAGETTAGSRHRESVLRLPGAEPEPWFDTVPERRGTLTEHRLRDRTIEVWSPPGAHGALPLVVLLDGECWPLVAELDGALDALVGSGELAPALVAFVHNTGGMAARTAELSCDDSFAAFLAHECVPFLRARHDTTPDRVVIGGDSLAGLAAAHAALNHPEVFGAVLSCSGSFWWGYRADDSGWGRDGEPEWLTRQIAARPPRDVEFWASVGSLETGASPLSPGVDQRAANRHLRDVLRAGGCAVTLVEEPGGHDFATFRRSAVRGLRALLPPDPEVRPCR
ncbi:alpha/beta hydrolase-fold protein [Umezawaea beigongshangensis]|uniref:alpha/beta hydrolase-fold protein n=1 Tax=Umezawaea beigongshangensis TaxID=2780383 RepID=UPI0027DD394C|nr:alpha/beta hydrolase-fold protein [Umezawaea beigongshangensis]